MLGLLSLDKALVSGFKFKLDSTLRMDMIYCLYNTCISTACFYFHTLVSAHGKQGKVCSNPALHKICSDATSSSTFKEFNFISSQYFETVKCQFFTSPFKTCPTPSFTSPTLPLFTPVLCSYNLHITFKFIWVCLPTITHQMK